MDRPKTKEEIIQQLSHKYNLPQTMIQKIVGTQFEFIRHQMAHGEVKRGIRLPRFGRFHVKPRRLQKLIENGGITDIQRRRLKL